MMIYRAIQLIQIFLAHERTDGRTDKGVPRGPRGPKNDLFLVSTAGTLRIGAEGAKHPHMGSFPQDGENEQNLS